MEKWEPWWITAIEDPASSQSNSSGDLDYNVYDDEADSHRPGKKRGTERLDDEGDSHLLTGKKRGWKRQRRDENASAEGEIICCHWCRQRTVRVHVRCSRCTVKFCPSCLLNRNGEKIEDEIKVRWVCPRCRGGCGKFCRNCCNCGPCRKSQGLGPTGQLVWDARKEGFTNAHDYLIHLKTGQTAEVIAGRKHGRRWTCATGAAVVVRGEVLPIPPWGKKRKRCPLTRGSSPRIISRPASTATQHNVIPSDMTETKEPVMPSMVKSEDQDSCTVHDKAEEIGRSLLECGSEDIQGGESIFTSDCQLSSTNSDQSSCQANTSLGVEGTESWRIRNGIPKRKRSIRKRTARLKEEELKGQHEMKEDERLSLRCEGGELLDVNCPGGELPDLNCPAAGSSFSSGQVTTGGDRCNETECQLPWTADSTESCLSVRTSSTLVFETEAATTTPNNFNTKLHAVLQRPFSGCQLMKMWEHFNFRRFQFMDLPSNERHSEHRPSQGYIDGLFCEFYSDLTEKLARTFYPAEKLKLLRGFFFWLQHSNTEGAFKPWVSDESENDQTEGCIPQSIFESQVINNLLAIEDN